METLTITLRYKRNMRRKGRAQFESAWSPGQVMQAEQSPCIAPRLGHAQFVKRNIERRPLPTVGRLHLDQALFPLGGKAADSVEIQPVRRPRLQCLKTALTPDTRSSQDEIKVLDPRHRVVDCEGQSKDKGRIRCCVRMISACAGLAGALGAICLRPSGRRRSTCLLHANATPQTAPSVDLL